MLYLGTPVGISVLVFRCLTVVLCFQIEVEEPGCAIFRHTSRYICAGDTSGKVWTEFLCAQASILVRHSGFLEVGFKPTERGFIFNIYQIFFLKFPMELK